MTRFCQRDTRHDLLKVSGTRLYLLWKAEKPDPFSLSLCVSISLSLFFSPLSASSHDHRGTDLEGVSGLGMGKQRSGENLSP